MLWNGDTGSRHTFEDVLGVNTIYSVKAFIINLDPPEIAD